MKIDKKNILIESIFKGDSSIEDRIIRKLHKDKRVVDINLIEDKPIIRIYSFSSIKLSDVVWILKNFTLNIIYSFSYQIECNKNKIFVDKYELEAGHKNKILKNKKNMQKAIKTLLNDRFFFHPKLSSLIYLENFKLEDILIFDALIQYQSQLSFQFKKEDIVDTLINFTVVSKLFLKYFQTKFDPFITKGREKFTSDIKAKIEKCTHKIKKIDEVRILEIFLKVLENIVRTNFYLNKDSIAFKIDTKTLKPYLNSIQPNIESFVYNQNFNGIHLRVSNVSRGGIRWSNRLEDYREEIKSLMFTQNGKNSIVVPSGAKGGFVIYAKDKKEITKEKFEKIYASFMDSLLDLIDNKKGNKIIENRLIVKYDKDDSYFVVAADKGTSSMSDVANRVSLNKNFWLKDAFASGGSSGYSHKEIGITAKGAIKCAERYFIEKNLNLYKQPISIVGIGSMNGDVFGNGVLESRYFKLIAAISHNEIFVDPNPNLEISYKERLRIFRLKNSSWSQYDREKISEGGGVFKRDESQILLSPQIQNLISANKRDINAYELIKKLLSLEVDMIYTAGVGTYFKSSKQSNDGVGDDENQYVRLDADKIKAFCICEGGNLGITQKGRIEYAKLGGKINLDAIDNSAGVDTSDHEVNFKILIEALLEKKIIDKNKKDQLIQYVGKNIVEDITTTNYLQALSISIDEVRSKSKTDSFIQVINILRDNLEFFKLEYFGIPKNPTTQNITGANGFILRPILSVLLMYSKIFIKTILDKHNTKDDKQFYAYYMNYFKNKAFAPYKEEIDKHYLKNQITNMVIANKIINNYGSSFIADFNEIGIEKFILKIKSYLTINRFLQADKIREQIYSKDYVLDVKIQYKLLLELEDKIEDMNRWVACNLKYSKNNLDKTLLYTKDIFKIISKREITQKQILEDNNIDYFFSILDYLEYSFMFLAKQIKNKENHVNDNLKIIFDFIDELGIISLLKSLKRIKSKDLSENILKEQLIKIAKVAVIKNSQNILKSKIGIKEYLRKSGFETDKFISLAKNIDASYIVNVSILVNALYYLKTLNIKDIAK